MWKYIIIGAITLLLLVGWVFTSNHNAMVVSQGEVQEVQDQFFSIVRENKTTFEERTDALWAEERAKYFDSRTKTYEVATEVYTGATNAITDLISGFDKQISEKRGEADRLMKEKDETMAQVATIVGKEGCTDEAEIKGVVTDLVEKNINLDRDVKQHQETLDAVAALSKDLKNQIEAGRQLNLDRQSRISPSDMECHIIGVDPQWETITLDAGVDKGIVIGSRLAVMRGDKQICELNVTLVQSNRSSCEIVYSTLLAGESVVSGDKVISVRNKK